MATINATIAISSDISDSPISLSKTMTMKKADSNVGMELTTGLSKRSFTSTNHVDLLTAETGIALDVTKDKAAKLYIKNVGSSSTEYFIIGMGKASTTGTEEGFDQADSAERYCSIGRLYGGDWMLIPWNADQSTHGYADITIKPSVATKMDVEYMVFYE